MDSLSHKEVGQIAEKIVQSKLRKFNYKAKKAPQKLGYDFLIDDTIRLEVKSSKLRKDNSWNFTFGTITPKSGKSDVHAFVFFYPDGSNKIRYMKTESLAFLMHKKKTRYGKSFRNPNDAILDKSPYSVFDKPKYTIKNI